MRHGNGRGLQPSSGAPRSRRCLFVADRSNSAGKLTVIIDWSMLGRFCPRQQVQGLLTHQNLAAGRGKNRLQAYARRFAPRTIPGDPNAVRRTQVGFAVVLGQLIGRERIFAIRCLS